MENADIYYTFVAYCLLHFANKKCGHLLHFCHNCSLYFAGENVGIYYTVYWLVFTTYLIMENADIDYTFCCILFATLS